LHKDQNNAEAEFQIFQINFTYLYIEDDENMLNNSLILFMIMIMRIFKDSRYSSQMESVVNGDHWLEDL
jgi:hypothetical protein